MIIVYTLRKNKNEVNEVKSKKKINPMETKGAYITQPISQADKRSKDAKIAIPNDENVERNKKWIEENKL